MANTPAAGFEMAAAAPSGGGDGAITVDSYQLVIQVNWEDPTTEQTITEYHIDVFGPDGAGQSSIKKDVVLAQLQKILTAHGGTGWSFP